MVTSRERVALALSHTEPDRVPLDLGSTAVTGIMATALGKLRSALGLEPRRVRIHEPYQMLGQVDDDLLDALDVDVIGLYEENTMFGFPAGGWKPFTLNNETSAQVPGGFNTERDANGDLYQYPCADRAAPPSGRMPAGGFYHDAIERQRPDAEQRLIPEEWVRDMYRLYTDEELQSLEDRSRTLHENTSRAIIGNFGTAGFGDIAHVPGLAIRQPRGIRAVADWYMATALHPEYVRGIFDLQLEIALRNLALYHQAVGDRIVAVFLSGTDFGAQSGSFISPRAYRDLYKPYHRAVNDWVHSHTSWKTFYHSCGSMISLYDDFVDAGVDIVNPVQISAAGMEPRSLKERWGEKLTFWGGGVDTQQVLPFGTPEEVSAHIRDNLEIFGAGGGFVYSAVHNIQATVPLENLLAMAQALRAWR
ncbi:MAG: methyltransferase [Chloroflexi bacterium]|nr:methyltransferase [Chloroflexota bacterium]